MFGSSSSYEEPTSNPSFGGGWKKQDIHRAGVESVGRFMYQDWDSASFTVEKFAEFCRTFFAECFFQSTAELKKNKMILGAIITPVRITPNVESQGEARNPNPIVF